jgi:hypothetical protein
LWLVLDHLSGLCLVWIQESLTKFTNAATEIFCQSRDFAATE